MTDEEKSRELAIKFCKDIDSNGKEVYNIGCEIACLEMARYKNEQLGWHDAKKEQPPMDEEVIVLTNVLNGRELSTPRRIYFGHIVDKKICVNYDGWNIPGVAYWMYDPKLKEDKKS